MRNFSLKTKRNFLQDSGRRELLTVIGLVVATCLVLFFLRGFIGGLFGSVMGGVLHVRNYFTHSTAVFPSYIRSRNELVSEIERLTDELASQSGDSATIARLSRENAELRGLVGDRPDTRILAGVLARPPMVPYDLLVIDRGTRDGILEGAIVYHTNNHAVGMVTRVYERNALVTLFSSSGVETSVYLYGPDIFAYAYGEGGGVIRISLPQGIEVHEGDPVVLPSLHMGDLGVVSRVVSLPTQPEQSAYVTFPVPLQSMRTVLVSGEAMVAVPFTELEPNVRSMTEMFKVNLPETALVPTSSVATSTGQSEE